MNKQYAIVCIFLALFSCGKKEQQQTSVSDVEFRLENLAEKGWKSKRINQYINNITYSATEVPNAYYILKNEGLSDLNKVDSIIALHKEERVIEVEFAHSSEDDLLKKEYTNRSYEDAVKYLAFSIKKDFMAVRETGDTIPCVGVQFERNFKVAPFKRAMLYFTGIPETERIQLIYQDQLFGNGTVKFNFKNNLNTSSK
jgi:hypothetical protein